MKKFIICSILLLTIGCISTQSQKQITPIEVSSSPVVTVNSDISTIKLEVQRISGEIAKLQLQRKELVEIAKEDLKSKLIPIDSRIKALVEKATPLVNRINPPKSKKEN